MNTKERSLGIRLGDMTELVSLFEESTGLSASTLAKELLVSALARWQKDSELKWPMVAVPKKEYESLLNASHQGLNEKGSGFGTKKANPGGKGSIGDSITSRRAPAPLPTYLIERKGYILEPLTTSAAKTASH